MAEELKIKVTVDAKDAQKELKKTKEAVEDTADEAQGSKSKWESLAQKFSAISPTFKSTSEKFQKSGEGVNDAFGGMLSSSKLMKLGVIGALAAIAVKAAKVAWQFANETASMFDPQGYQEAAGEMQRSIKKLKTAIGSFTAPIVEGIMKGISKVVDGITWLVEKIRVAVSFISGVFTSVIQPVVDAIKAAIQWLQNGINTIANFLGFGDVFKASTESAQETADEVGEIVDATSAGLAGFDKLNTLDVSGSGDTEEADKIAEDMAEAKSDGMKLGDMIKNAIKNIDLGGLWDGFKSTLKGIPGKIRSALGGLSSWLGSQWAGFTSTMGGLWGGFTSTMGRLGSWLGSQWAGFTSTMGGLWAGFTSSMGQMSAWLGSQWAGFTQTMGGLWEGFLSVMGTIGEFLGGAWDGFKQTMSGLWEGFTTTMADMCTWLGDQWANFTEILGGLWDDFKDVFKDLRTWFSDRFEEVKEDIVSIFTKAWDKVKEAFERMIAPVKATIEGLQNIVGTVKDKVSGAIGGVKSALGLASGGAVAPNSPALYTLGDNTREYEVVSPVSLMKDTVKAAIAEMGGTGGSSQSSPVELTINLDGKKMARAIYDPLQTETRRRGGTSA